MFLCSVCVDERLQSSRAARQPTQCLKHPPLPPPRLPPNNFQRRPAAPTSCWTCAPPVALVICPSHKNSSACLLTSKLPTHFGGKLWSKTKGMARRTGGVTDGCACETNWCTRRDIKMLQRACTGASPCHLPPQSTAAATPCSSTFQRLRSPSRRPRARRSTKNGRTAKLQRAPF